MQKVIKLFFQSFSVSNLFILEIYIIFIRCSLYVNCKFGAFKVLSILMVNFLIIIIILEY